MTHDKTVGSRAEVWHGTAKKTSGGLSKSHLMKTKAGRIVSKKKHFTAKKEMRLLKHGYGTKKGHFGFVKMDTRKRHRGKKMGGKMAPRRGGSYALNPSPYSGEGTGMDPSTGVQMRAGLGN